MEREIQIESDGVKVPLNAFAKRVALNTILGLVGSLRGVDSGNEIRIVVTPATSPHSGG